ncbi:8192_t:CDS:2 [Ambispora gerdemannii]|uniref:8192_t:CDS:1 n=1 Tax=Ambispora gerdemannii TaxID=144530 RepID=A0A9N8YUI0_9GLOM|nr:8192_t:CDS:2 [Ambispora gerdemannii]
MNLSISLVSRLFRLLFLFNAVNVLQAFIPLPRFGHNANLINNKIYYFGGKDSNGNVSHDLFYLDLTLTSTPQYLYASNSSKSPEFSLLNYTGDFQGTYLSGSTAWKNSIYAFGGEGAKEGDFKNTFIKIRIDSNPIIIEQLDNTNAPSPRGRLTPVVDKQGKIYFFGGWDGTGSDNTMYIFDSNSATWTTVKSDSAPDMIWGYAAILTDDERILYIGGNHHDKIRYMPFDSIPVFNINTSDWERINTTADIPIAGRVAHVAILDRIYRTNDVIFVSINELKVADKKRVIIYGGERDSSDKTTNGGIVVLDLSTKKFTQPNIEGKRPDYIPYRTTATYFNDYIFVAFGNRNNIPSVEFNILDIYNGTLKWVQMANLTRPPSNGPDNGAGSVVDKPSANVGILIILAIVFGIKNGRFYELEIPI